MSRTGKCRVCGRSGWMSYLLFGAFTYDLSAMTGICGRCDTNLAKKLSETPHPSDIIFNKESK